jgi:hypothetical protein
MATKNIAWSWQTTNAPSLALIVFGHSKYFTVEHPENQPLIRFLSRLFHFPAPLTTALH